jgi:hypothetical protein
MQAGQVFVAGFGVAWPLACRAFHAFIGTTTKHTALAISRNEISAFKNNPYLISLR